MRTALACPACGTRLIRIHRTAWQRLIYREVHQCRNCRSLTKRSYELPRVNLWFYLSRYARCRGCGSTNVQRVLEPAQIDVTSTSSIGYLQHLIGAPSIRCNACFSKNYDWRPLAQQAQRLDEVNSQT